MNIRRTYLTSCFALLFSAASFAEVNCETKPLIESDITLSQNQLASIGGYISSDFYIVNESCENMKFKYWLSVKGPQGLYFPAKSVVGVDTALEYNADLSTGRKLNVTRGFWIPQYMADGQYTVSLQVVAENGEIFKTDKTFVKGVNPHELPELDRLTIDIQNQFDISSVETSGYIPFSIALKNGRESAAKVEFWMNAIGPNGLIIPVHAREKWTIESGDTYSKIRGFNFDKSYPAGEYIINTQIVDTVSGKRVEQSMTVVKK
ncbi:RbmA family biofilm matrix protein [Vibrio cholerae]